MNTKSPGETNPTGLADCLAKLFLVSVFSNRPDEAERQNTCCPSGKDDLETGLEETLGLRQHAGRQREILLAEGHGNDAGVRRCNVFDLKVGVGSLDHCNQTGMPRLQTAFRLEF